jgi:hypothetical protein
MVGSRTEDRVEVDRCDPEIGQPVEVLGDTEDVAALVPVERRRSVPRLEVDGLAYTVRLRETIGEDLIEDGVVYPWRSVMKTSRGAPIALTVFTGFWVVVAIRRHVAGPSR